MTVSNQATIKSASANYNFGPTQTNWTLARSENCTSGGPFNICSICKVIDCTFNLEVSKTSFASSFFLYFVLPW